MAYRFGRNAEADPSSRCFLGSDLVTPVESIGLLKPEMKNLIAPLICRECGNRGLSLLVFFRRTFFRGRLRF
jgi:hypothetical protein